MLRWSLVYVICNSKHFSFICIQTLYNDCPYIENVQLPFCGHLIDVFEFLRGVELRHFTIRNAYEVFGLCDLVTQTVFIPLYSNFA